MSVVATPPPLSVELDGANLSDENLLCLSDVRVQQQLSLPTLCELTFLYADVPALSFPAPRLGATLRVVAGQDRGLLFAGEITALEHGYDSSRGRQLRVRAYDPLHRLRKRQPVRAHVQQTLVDLVKEFVTDLRLSVQADDAGPLWQRVFQFRQTDLDLLTELAERCGKYFFVTDDVLHILTLEGAGDSVDLALGENLFEARVEVNGDRACSSVETAGWNTSSVQPHHGQAGTARVGRNVSATVSPSDFGGTGLRTFAGEDAQDDSHAEAIAQAELDSRVAGEVTFWGIADGDVRFRPGAPIEVKGVAPELEGRYIATKVIHTVGRKKGFTSEIWTTPPPLRIRQKGTVTAPGTVSAVNDPDGFGRVRVKLPTYCDLETGWMGVVSPGAGAGKGFITLPDVGDQVLVLFAHEDPTRGIVLGGLYGSNQPPDAGVESTGIRRFTLLTPGGQRIRLDDDHNTIHIQDQKGSYLELSPEKVRLHSEVDLLIEAPGKEIVFQSDKIDFKRI